MFETPPPPQLRVKNLVVFKVYCNTFEVTFQCLEMSTDWQDKGHHRKGSMSW